MREAQLDAASDLALHGCPRVGGSKGQTGFPKVSTGVPGGLFLSVVEN